VKAECLSQSGTTATELQLLSGEVVHLRQRLQMEVLANQELEEVISRFSLHFSKTLTRSHCLSYKSS
jgi:hypothetical protein